jgi:hypothetical protein
MSKCPFYNYYEMAADDILADFEERFGVVIKEDDKDINKNRDFLIHHYAEIIYEARWGKK